MHVAPSFSPSFLATTPPISEPAKWDQVHLLYDQGKYLASLQALLHFFKPDLNIPASRGEKGFSVQIPHGSIWLKLTVTPDRFKAELPFLHTGSASLIPLYRQIAQLNFSPLNLSRIRLQEQSLFFEYQCTLESCQPDKVHAVLREMCLYADTFDDEFIEKFGATHIEPPPIAPLTASEQQAVWERVQACLAETQAYITYFEARRKFGFAWDMALICLLQIEYMANPQGMVRTRLERAVSDLQGNGPLVERLNYGKAFLQELQQYTPEAFFKDLYRIPLFIPYKYQGSPEQIRSALEEAHQAARKERDSGEFIAATLSLYTALLRLFFYYYLPPAVAAHITGSLQAAAGMTWGEASEALWQVVSQLLQDEELLHGRQRPVARFWQRLKKGWS